MKLLLAIKPEYVNKIFSNEKHFEFRKTKPKQKIDTIIIYETAPISKIVGEFQVKTTIIDTPENIWNITKNKGTGISKEAYDKYYHNKSQAVAFEIENFKKYSNPKSLTDFNLKAAPQGYIYIK